MTSKIGNSSLRNSMYRHPQMVSRTKIFAGQDSNSSATYLRWLGPVWEQAHKGDVPEQYLPWKREYLPVGLANGAAGSHIGLDSFWKYAGGSQDVAGNVIDQFDIFNNSTYDSTEFNQITGTGVTSIKSYDYPADNPYAGQAYANTSYNDQIGANRFGWPYGEYQPVFGDAGGGGKSFWRTFPQTWLGDYDMWHPMEFNEDGSDNLVYRRDGSSNPPVGYINGKWAKEYSYYGNNEDTIDGINPFWIYNVQIVDSYLAPNPPYDSATFIFRVKPNSLDNPYYTSGYGDFNDYDTAQMLYWLGYDPDDLNNIMDTMTLHVTNNNTNEIFQYSVPVSKLIQGTSGRWGFFGGDFTPNLPNGDYPYEEGEWDGSPGIMFPFTPLWGTDPVIQWKFRRHKAWDVRPRNWGMTMGSDSGQIIGGGVGWNYYTPHGHVERQPEIRTSTRSVLLYDLTPTLPSGAPIMKAELFLTSKARTNWPDNQLADDWPTDADELTDETGPRRYKVGAGPQYQLSLLHPLTTKQCTWGTYDGTNPWTDLIANTAGNQTIGGTCSILPNVFNLGQGYSGGVDQDSIKWYGLGWRNNSIPGGSDQNGDGFHDNDESVSIHDNRVAYQRFHYESNDINVSEPSKFQINAVTAGSPVEIAGITGGGVMVVPSRKEEVGTRNDNGHAVHPSDGHKRGFMNPANASKFTQGEIVAATGRRYDDVKDFNFNTGTGAGGSKVVLDVTDFAKYAVNNLGGKMRLAITGKTLNGAAKNEDPHDKWKSESTWSHYAYQYYPRYKIDHNGVVQSSTQTNYGGGIGDADGTARAQFPQCGPHTVRTEFYSMNDESNSEEFEEIQFKNALQSGTSSYDDVIDMTDLITDFQALNSLDTVQNFAVWNYAKITQYGNNYSNESSRGMVSINFQIMFNDVSGAPTLAEAEALGFNAWMEKAFEMRDRLAVHDQYNGTDTIKIVCPKIVGSNGEIVTIGEDDIGTDSESIGYKLKSQGASVSYHQGLPVRLEYISFYFKLDYPVVDGLIPADGKTLIRHYGTGENYYPHASSQNYFHGYFLGDLSHYAPTLGENSEWATSLSTKFDEIPVDNSLSNYICSEFSSFPVSAVGDAFGITHDIPAGQGITHDNRGAYSVKSIIEPNIIEVNETVTKQFIDNSDDSYGTIKATNFSNRPYLKITYSEQEDYGV